MEKVNLPKNKIRKRVIGLRLSEYELAVLKERVHDGELSEFVRRAVFKEVKTDD